MSPLYTTDYQRDSRRTIVITEPQTKRKYVLKFIINEVLNLSTHVILSDKTIFLKRNSDDYWYTKRN